MLQFLLCLMLSSLRVGGQQEFYCNPTMPETIIGVSEGIIKTRNAGTEYYGNEFDCVWKINATENKRIQLTIEALDLEWSPQYTTCTGYDNLEVLEGYTEGSPVLTSICHARNPFSIVSQEQFLYLRFTSTHQNFGNKRGIDIKFKMFNNGSCPPDWFQVSPSSTDCLMIGHTGQADWRRAQDICTYNKANLASILSESEFITILEQGWNVSSLSSAWIGLSDMVQEGTFKWLDKHQLSYKSDIVGHSYNTHCVVQDFTTEKWSVLNCDSVQNYICKAKKDGSTILYQADPPSKPPEEDAGGTKLFLIVIVIVVIIALCIIGCVLLYCLYIRHDNKCSQQNAQSGKQSAAEGSAPDPHAAVFTPLEPRESIPSAPPQENVMIHDFQMNAPPTYAESQLDPVSPSNY